MGCYKNYKERALQDPQVKREYNTLQSEYDIIQATIEARAQQNITQKDLSTRTGITQIDISRLEIRDAIKIGIYSDVYKK